MLEFEFHSTNINYTKEQMEEYKKLISFYRDFSSVFKSVYDQAYERSVDKDYFKAYQRIIKRVADLCDKFDSTRQPILINLIFEYLLWGGYLSKNHRYAYDTGKRVNNFACPGADIMRGHGVCLNHADMLTKIYQELGYEAYTMGITVDKSIKQLNIWKPNIERNIDNNSLFINLIGKSKLLKRFGNHAITIVKKDVYELYDPTNLVVLKPTDVLKASFIGSEEEFDLKIWAMIVLSGLLEDNEHTEVSDVCNLLFAQGVSNTNTLLPLDAYKEICIRMLSFLDSAEPLLNNLHDSIKNDIDIVVRSLVNERGKKRG